MNTTQEQVIFSVDEVSRFFDKVQSRCLDFEDGIVPTTQSEGYLSTISDLNNMQHAIINHSLFSPNEELEEIATENLKYLLVPYYMGLASSKISQDRLKNIEFAQLYLGEFLKLANHYELVSKDVKKQWKNLSDEGNVNVSRDDKIASYKSNKALKEKLNNLEQVKEESDRREAILTHIQISILNSIDILRSNLEEIPILEYKRLIESDPKAKEAHEKLNQRPIPKPTITKIAKQEDKSTPFMLDQHKGKVQYLCNGCVQTKEEYRHELRQQVFTPGTTMPTVTLDEFADIAVEEMRQAEESSKIAKQKQDELDEQDSDRDSVGDPKQEEARRWDDWKDENEKGAGNRFGK